MLLSESGCNNKDTCIDIVSIVSLNFLLLCVLLLPVLSVLSLYVYMFFLSDLYYLEFGGVSPCYVVFHST